MHESLQHSLLASLVVHPHPKDGSLKSKHPSEVRQRQSPFVLQRQEMFSKSQAVKQQMHPLNCGMDKRGDKVSGDEAVNREQQSISPATTDRVFRWHQVLPTMQASLVFSDMVVGTVYVG